MKQRGQGRVGRPQKFAEPSRVVTVTLPESTLRDLEAIDPDRARAIVKATSFAVAGTGTRDSAVDVVAVARDSAVITVPFSPLLAEIEGVELMHILPSRYLVVLAPGKPLSELELAIQDKIDALEAARPPEIDILEQLLLRLRDYRRADRSRLAEVILIDV